MDEPEDINDPLVVVRETSASRRAVWDVVADGWAYSQWVVGNSRMRAVDPAWPAPGSVIHHTIGVWPLTVDDETEVELCVPASRIVLIAKGRPLAAARVTIRLSDTEHGGAGCRWPRCRSGGLSDSFLADWRWRRRGHATVNASAGCRRSPNAGPSPNRSD